jgi:hypothetical protein
LCPIRNGWYQTLFELKIVGTQRGAGAQIVRRHNDWGSLTVGVGTQCGNTGKDDEPRRGDTPGQQGP